MDHQAFINSVKDQAMQDMTGSGVFASVTIAQAILESNWGSSGLATAANNLFGIKKGTWTGPIITLPTKEYRNGIAQTESAAFRAYQNFSQSIKDHTALLMQDRYKPVREAKTYQEQCNELYECGYATDPLYAAKLITVIEYNNLVQYDKYEKLGVNEMGAIKKGEKSGRVKALQVLLNLVGASLSTDGDFGTNTEGAVKAFQAAKGLDTDGVFGPMTENALIEKIKAILSI